MRNAILALFLLASPALGQTQMLKSTAPDGVTIACQGTDASSYGVYAATAASRAYPLAQSSQAYVHVYSDAGSTATVIIRVGLTSTGPWYPVATITNPSATGEAWAVPRYPWVSISVTWTAGNVKACLVGYRDDKVQY